MHKTKTCDVISFRYELVIYGYLLLLNGFSQINYPCEEITLKLEIYGRFNHVRKSFKKYIPFFCQLKMLQTNWKMNPLESELLLTSTAIIISINRIVCHAQPASATSKTANDERMYLWPLFKSKFVLVVIIIKDDLRILTTFCHWKMSSNQQVKSRKCYHLGRWFKCAINFDKHEVPSASSKSREPHAKCFRKTLTSALV